MGIQITGHGHCVGERLVDNKDHDVALGLPVGWLQRHTGIATRRVRSASQTVVGMAAEAVEAACKEARLELHSLGPETAILHIQNGGTRLTPPGVIQVASELGLGSVKPLGIDGVCAEPIAALEIADLMIGAGKVDRAIISASVDFMDFVDPTDKATVGLFGAGAGALVVERSVTPEGMVRGLSWVTDTSYATAGEIPVLSVRPGVGSVSVEVGHYTMDGTQLATVALAVVPELVALVLSNAGWTIGDVSHLVAHQPNARLLEIGIRKLGLSPEKVSMPVREHGNMGPASLLVAYSQARSRALIGPGSRVLLVAFGLGFSAGVAAIEL